MSRSLDHEAEVRGLLDTIHELKERLQDMAEATPSQMSESEYTRRLGARIDDLEKQLYLQNKALQKVYAAAACYIQETENSVWETNYVSVGYTPARDALKALLPTPRVIPSRREMKRVKST